MNLIEEINHLRKELTQSIKLLRQNGNALAEAERDYKVELAQESLRLKTEENMNSSMIDKVVYGVQSVADKRFKRDVARVMYESNLEHIKATKKNLTIVENQLAREWSNADNIYNA